MRTLLMPKKRQQSCPVPSRPKLAFVAQPKDIVSPTSTASIGIIIYETARRLAQHYDVTIFTRQHPALADEETDGGVRYRRINTNLDDRMTYYLRRISERVSGIFHRPIRMFSSHVSFQPFYFFCYAMQIALAARRERFDIIQVSNYTQFLPIIRLLNPGARIVFNIQCEWLTQMRPRLARRRLTHMDVVLGCSDFITTGIRRTFPTHQAKCATLYNGVDLALFTPGPQDQKLQQGYGLTEGETILFVGRLTPEKGVHVLLDAMRTVVARHPRAVLVVVGAFSYNPPLPPGARNAEADWFEAMKVDYRGVLLEKASSLGEHVKFVGSFPPAELPAFYRTADIFVHPALWHEPFGMILVEAMACARAVIATPTGGIPEIVREGENGRLVPPNDPQALAAALIAMLESPEETARLGQRGRQDVERRFSWDRMATDLDTVYRGLLHSDGPRAGVREPAVTF